MAERRVCVVTGSRAEYGLLRPLLHAITADAGLDLQLVVTGMHLSSEHGNTWQAIVADGFSIDERVETLLASDSAHAVNSALSLGMTGFSHAWEALRPDIIVVLGDRYEILPAVVAAMVHGIPIAHIHGGEISEGAIDDAIRHAITKMAQLHFTATEVYRRRVVQLGEDPGRVHNVGALAADNIAQLPLLDKAALEAALGLELSGPLFLVTYHPVTLNEADSTAGLDGLLEALDRFPEARVIFTQANADTGGSMINRRIDDYVGTRAERCVRFDTLGSLRYLSAMRQATAVIGNSSSGIIEAPILGVPTVNIGERQRGRLRTPSIIDCAAEAPAIAAAIEQAAAPAFRSGLAEEPSPYGCGGTAERICQHLRDTNLTGLLHKRFHESELSEVTR